MAKNWKIDLLCFTVLDRFDQMLEDTNDTENMVNQVLHKTVKIQQSLEKISLPTDQEVRLKLLD